MVELVVSPKLRRIRGSYLVCVLGGAALVYKGLKMDALPFGTLRHALAKWVVLLGGWLFAYGFRWLFRKPEDDF
jgi:hypothetical protein